MQRVQLMDEGTAVNPPMNRVKHKIVVLSGKGGVGKSTVAANLALAFADKFPQGKVGIIDLDFSGPNIPKMLGVEDERVRPSEKNRFLPVDGPKEIKLVSMGFFLDSPSTPVVWRGPIKIKAMRQFLSDFDWGELEVLIFDMPPGTGDEAITIMQLIPDMDGIVIVTTPQEVSLLDTGKSLMMSREMQRPVLGIIENMATFKCPNCETEHPIFGEGGGKRMAKEFDSELIGQIPLDPSIRLKEDIGLSKAFDYFKPVVEKLIEKFEASSE